MTQLSELKAKYLALKVKKNLSGKEALEAVKQDGYALGYVNSDFFESETEKYVTDDDGKKYRLVPV